MVFCNLWFLFLFLFFGLLLKQYGKHVVAHFNVVSTVLFIFNLPFVASTTKSIRFDIEPSSNSLSKTISSSPSVKSLNNSRITFNANSFCSTPFSGVSSINSIIYLITKCTVFGLNDTFSNFFLAIFVIFINIDVSLSISSSFFNTQSLSTSIGSKLFVDGFVVSGFVVSGFVGGFVVGGFVASH